MAFDSSPTLKDREIRNVRGIEVVVPTDSDKTWYCEQVGVVCEQLEQQIGQKNCHWFVGGVGRDSWLYSEPSTVISPAGTYRDLDLHTTVSAGRVTINSVLKVGYPHMRCLKIDPNAQGAWLCLGSVMVPLRYEKFETIYRPFGDITLPTFSPNVLMCLMGLGHVISRPLRPKDIINLEQMSRYYGPPDSEIMAGVKEFHRRVREETRIRSALIDLGCRYGRSGLERYFPISRGPLRRVSLGILSRLYDPGG